MRNDGTNIKEKKLKAGRGKATIDVDHTGKGIPAAEKKYKVKFKKNKLPKNLMSIPVTKPGSRFIK